MEILYFFESIRNPVLNAIMSVLTFLGSEVGFLGFALAFYWCVDKRRGYYVMSVGFLGVIINQVMKILFMIPRPWVIDPEFTIVDGAKADAGGYSFPSGHTQNSTGTFASILRFTKQNWLRAICIFSIIIVPITRMYLGVHTPLDVGVSLIIGFALAFALYPIFEYCSKTDKRMIILLSVFFAISTLFVIFSYAWPFPADIDPHNLYSLRKNACTLIGSVGGVLLLYPIERKYINFDVKATLAGQAVKLVLGLGVVMAFKESVKAVFKLLGGGEELLWMRSVRYFLVVVLAMGVYPLLFKYFSSLGRKKESTTQE